MALVILRAAAARVEQELRERDVGIAAMTTFLVVHEAPEPYQCLLHFLVPVEPFFLTGTDVSNPTIGELLRRLVQTQVFPIRQGVVVDRRLDEIAGDITFVIATMIGRPSLGPTAAVGERVGRL